MYYNFKDDIGYSLEKPEQPKLKPGFGAKHWWSSLSASIR